MGKEGNKLRCPSCAVGKERGILIVSLEIPLYVAVNGESYLIPRGVEVEVPYYIAEVIENSLKEDQKTAEQLRILEENYAGK